MVWLVYVLVGLVMLGPIVACVAVVVVVIGRRKRRSKQQTHSNHSSCTSVSFTVASDPGNKQAACQLAAQLSSKPHFDTCAESPVGASFDATVANLTSNTPTLLPTASLPSTNVSEPLPATPQRVSPSTVRVCSSKSLVAACAALGTAPEGDLAEATEGRRRRRRHQPAPGCEGIRRAPDSAQAALYISSVPLIESPVSAPNAPGSGPLCESSEGRRRRRRHAPGSEASATSECSSSASGRRRRRRAPDAISGAPGDAEGSTEASEGGQRRRAATQPQPLDPPPQELQESPQSLQQRAASAAIFLAAADIDECDANCASELV